MFTSTKVMIWGISGKLGSGKDYVAHRLLEVLRARGRWPMIISFADQIKVHLAAQDGVAVETLFGSKTAATRRRLQTVGTEEGRDRFGADYWIRIVDAWIRIWRMRGVTDIIIPDVRFRNEAEWIKGQGGRLIRLTAHDRHCLRLCDECGEDAEAQRRIVTHSSETELDDFGGFDHWVNNSIKGGNDIGAFVEDLASLASLG